MDQAEYQRIFNLPFEEASNFFRDKLNIPTKAWTDLWKEEHAKGFMVAGAYKTDLLTDFREAVQKAIDGKMTLKDFQERFDEIVKQRGWDYNGSRNWRSALIYNTNVRSAYMAGRWQQLTEPGSKLPYLVYRHADGVRHPRPLHVSWNGITLPADHEFWKTHFPQNGWGCRCTVFAASEKDLQAAIAAGKGEPPAGYNTYTETDVVDKNSVVVRTRRTLPGIDEGWDYNVGKSALGSPKEWAPDKPDVWQPLGKERAATWETLGRPKTLPGETTATRFGKPVSTQQGMVSAVQEAIGGESAVYAFTDEYGYPFAVNVDAGFVGNHLKLDRGKYIPFLKDVLEDPYEVWLHFEQHAQTGQVRLGMQILKAIVDADGKTLIMGAQTAKGQLEGWTFFHTEDMKYVNRKRWGKMIVGKNE